MITLTTAWRIELDTPVQVNQDQLKDHSNAAALTNQLAPGSDILNQHVSAGTLSLRDVSKLLSIAANDNESPKKFRRPNYHGRSNNHFPPISQELTRAHSQALPMASKGVSVLIVGYEGCGKDAMRSRFSSGEFPSTASHQERAQGASYHTITRSFDGDRIGFEMWCLSGLGSYFLNPSFYANTSIIYCALR